MKSPSARCTAAFERAGLTRTRGSQPGPRRGSRRAVADVSTRPASSLLAPATRAARTSFGAGGRAQTGTSARARRFLVPDPPSGTTGTASTGSGTCLGLCPHDTSRSSLPVIGWFGGRRPAGEDRNGGGLQPTADLAARSDRTAACSSAPRPPAVRWQPSDDPAPRVHRGPRRAGLWLRARAAV
jgi:hypothetical protein